MNRSKKVVDQIRKGEDPDDVIQEALRERAEQGLFEQRGPKLDDVDRDRLVRDLPESDWSRRKMESTVDSAIDRVESNINQELAGVTNVYGSFPDQFTVHKEDFDHVRLQLESALEYPFNVEFNVVIPQLPEKSNDPFFRVKIVDPVKDPRFAVDVIRDAPDMGKAIRTASGVVEGVDFKQTLIRAMTQEITDLIEKSARDGAFPKWFESGGHAEDPIAQVMKDAVESHRQVDRVTQVRVVDDTAIVDFLVDGVEASVHVRKDGYKVLYTAGDLTTPSLNFDVTIGSDPSKDDVRDAVIGTIEGKVIPRIMGG